MATPSRPRLQHGWHCVYDMHYHFVFVVKYRRALLTPEVVTELTRISLEIQERHEFEMLGHEIEMLGHEIEMLGHEIEMLGHEIEMLGHEIEMLGADRNPIGTLSTCSAPLTPRWPPGTSSASTRP